ncbi:MAG: PDZ domain-containing protein, partial [Planctomycetota bacterium]
RSVKFDHPTPHRWVVPQHDGTVVFEYRLFGNRCDGTYSQITSRHAHLNAPATFVWTEACADRPHVVRFDLPKASRWKVASQLKTTKFGYFAPNLAYLLDSPIGLSDHHLIEWDLLEGGRVATIRLAVHHDGSKSEAETYGQLARAVVNEQIGIFGELPKFDYGSYTFIADYHAAATGDGMEHRNSTVLTSSRALKGSGMVRNLGTLSHEFVHAWNVERLRPKSLEPFDFERPNVASELWFAEGFTSYYTYLVICRAGIISVEDYASRLARTISAVTYSPGRRFRSPEDMSCLATLVDGGNSIDPVNWKNTYISYYTYGSAVGLALDLTLRSRFRGKDLDGYMRFLWNAFGREETPYTPQDLERTLGKFVGDESFARNFFGRHVRGRELVDYARLLRRAGLDLRNQKKGQASFGGLSLDFEQKDPRVTSSPRNGSPFYEAGIGLDDKLVRVGGRRIRSQSDLDAIESSVKPGEVVEVEFRRGGRIDTCKLRAVEGSSLELRPVERGGAELSKDQRAFRSRWLDSKAPARTKLPRSFTDGQLQTQRLGR